MPICTSTVQHLENNDQSQVLYTMGFIVPFRYETYTP